MKTKYDEYINYMDSMKKWSDRLPLSYDEYFATPSIKTATDDRSAWSEANKECINCGIRPATYGDCCDHCA